MPCGLSRRALCHASRLRSHSPNRSQRSNFWPFEVASSSHGREMKMAGSHRSWARLGWALTSRGSGPRGAPANGETDSEIVPWKCQSRLPRLAAPPSDRRLPWGWKTVRAFPSRGADADMHLAVQGGPAWIERKFDRRAVDAVLREFASRLEKHLPPAVHPCRWGAAPFAVFAGRAAEEELLGVCLEFCRGSRRLWRRNRFRSGKPPISR